MMYYSAELLRTLWPCFRSEFDILDPQIASQIETLSPEKIDSILSELETLAPFMPPELETRAQELVDYLTNLPA